MKKETRKKFPILLLLPALVLLAGACQQKSGQEQAEEVDTRPPVPMIELEKQAYLKDGQSISAKTFAVMSAALSRALDEGGVANAVEYCSLAAYPLVDSLSKANEAKIRRTSLRVRNPLNSPDSMELEVLREYEEMMKAGNELAPVLKLPNRQTVAYFAPILIQPLCLSCHGKVGEEISEANYALIREKYPDDKAVGYALGELRGIWSIQMERNLELNDYNNNNN